MPSVKTQSTPVEPTTNGNGPKMHVETNDVISKQQQMTDDSMAESISYQLNGVQSPKISASQMQNHESMIMMNGNGKQEESSPNQTSVVKHSLLQFALQHFRNE